MFTAEYKGINSFLVGVSRKLLKEGICRETRSVKSWELPYPVIIKITNPLARLVTLPIRKWNLFLPYAESLWLASGSNDLDMIGSYLPKMRDFSDDNEFIRGGYGPRLRRYNGNGTDYKMSFENTSRGQYTFKEVDQIKYVIERLKSDKYSRRAVITIGDPAKDFFEDESLKQTKDFPCTCLLQFQVSSVTNKLDLTVYLRSNDFIWGATAVNIFNYTYIQEYISMILGIEIGDYYHITNNLHYYEHHSILLEDLAKTDDADIADDFYVYDKSFSSLEDFDLKIGRLSEWEHSFRSGLTNAIADMGTDYLNDWAKILAIRLKGAKVQLTNTILNELTKNL